MKRIQMTATRLGASDGYTVREYEEGKTYSVSDDLAKDFIGAKVAVEAPDAPELEAADGGEEDSKADEQKPADEPKPADEAKAAKAKKK